MEIQLLGRKGAPTSQSEWKEELTPLDQTVITRSTLALPHRSS